MSAPRYSRETLRKFSTYSMAPFYLDIELLYAVTLQSIRLERHPV